MKFLVGTMAALLFFAFSETSSFALGSHPSEPVPVEIGKPYYYGSGCPTGSAHDTGTSTAFTLNFDEYFIDTDSSTLTIKNCVVVVGVKLPARHQIVISELQYRGGAFIPDGGYAELQTYVRLQDTAGFHKSPVKKKSFNGGFEDNFEYFTQPQLSSVRCGGLVHIYLHSSLRARAPASTHEQTLIALDTLDASAQTAIEMNFFLKKCP